MITIAQCKAHSDKCRVLASGADVSMRRHIAIMAICQTWDVMAQRVADYDAIVKRESTSSHKSAMRECVELKR
jgi:hypothetical protein